ncbi:MAG: hypothetical protein MJA27_06240 [Pseudanabaenales cyanobacterium]|nr:hypothetical protein [Pseudanabaenales cyanobacterium]
MTTAFCAVCVSAIVGLQQPHLRRLKGESMPTSVMLTEDETAEKLRLNLLQRLPTFGFKNVVADWTFLTFLQYFGDDLARAQKGYRLTPDYFEVIISQDPYFIDFYLFLSGSATLYAGMPDRSIALMEKGLNILQPDSPPDSFFVWRYKGVEELLFLADSQAAQHSFESAADWASQSSHPQGPELAEASRQTAQFLARNPRSKKAQINAWQSILANAFDDPTRQLAISRIEALGGRVILQANGEMTIQYPSED